MKVDIKLRRFNMSQMKDDNVVLFIGKRNTGKSFLIRDVMHHFRDIPLGTVISGTEIANGFYRKFMPDIFVHFGYSSDLLANVIKRQVVMHDKSGTIDTRAFLILDDLMDDAKSWVKDPSIKTAFFNGRHFKLFFILSMQYSLGISPELRSNVDYVFILRECLNSNRKRLFEHYAGMFGTFEIFCKIMDECTEDYECIVIDNTTKSNKLTDQVFWYKASPHEEFRIGHSQFWNAAKNAEVRARRVAVAHGLDEKTNGNNLGRKPSKIRINVRKVFKDDDDDEEGGDDKDALF